MSHVDQARAMLPVTAQTAYLNTANMGPVTTLYAERLAQHTQEDVRSGRAIARRYEQLEEAKERLRQELAWLLGCEVGRLALTQSTSHGLRRVLGSFDWAPGDEVITTGIEHESLLIPLRAQAARCGVKLRVAAMPNDCAGYLGWLEGHITPKTRLIAFSAVAFGTGARLPVAGIAGLARERGILTLVDAAQQAGALDLPLGELDVDFCAMPLQKWLLGPEGLGALYVRESTSAERGPGVTDAVRHGRPVFEAAAAQLAWMRESLGWPSIFDRTRTLATYTREKVGELEGADLLTPAEFAGITTLRCAPAGSPGAAAELARRGFLVRQLPELCAFRISTACFNTQDEIDGLFSILAEMAAVTEWDAAER